MYLSLFHLFPFLSHSCNLYHHTQRHLVNMRIYTICYLYSAVSKVHTLRTKNFIPLYLCFKPSFLMQILYFLCLFLMEMINYFVTHFFTRNFNLIYILNLNIYIAKNFWPAVYINTSSSIDKIVNFCAQKFNLNNKIFPFISYCFLSSNRDSFKILNNDLTFNLFFYRFLIYLFFPHSNPVGALLLFYICHLELYLLKATLWQTLDNCYDFFSQINEHIEISPVSYDLSVRINLARSLSGLYIARLFNIFSLGLNLHLLLYELHKICTN
jgi:hypothetical protein